MPGICKRSFLYRSRHQDIDHNHEQEYRQHGCQCCQKFYITHASIPLPAFVADQLFSVVHACPSFLPHSGGLLLSHALCNKCREVLDNFLNLILCFSNICRIIESAGALSYFYGFYNQSCITSYGLIMCMKHCLYLLLFASESPII